MNGRQLYEFWRRAVSLPHDEYNVPWSYLTAHVQAAWQKTADKAITEAWSMPGAGESL